MCLGTRRTTRGTRTSRASRRGASRVQGKFQDCHSSVVKLRIPKRTCGSGTPLTLMVSPTGGPRLRGAKGQPWASRGGPQRGQGQSVSFLCRASTLCLTSHLCDLQGNAGAPGLPGLMGFPSVGVPGEKVRPTQTLGSTSGVYTLMSVFRGTQGLLDLLAQEDLLDWGSLVPRSVEDQHIPSNIYSFPISRPLG